MKCVAYVEPEWNLVGKPVPGQRSATLASGAWVGWVPGFVGGVAMELRRVHLALQFGGVLKFNWAKHFPKEPRMPLTKIQHHEVPKHMGVHTSTLRPCTLSQTTLKTK
jgi:hypothetical protein